MDVDKVPPRERCTIRQLANLTFELHECHLEHLLDYNWDDYNYDYENYEYYVNKTEAFKERFVCEGVEHYMEKCLGENLAVCYPPGSPRYLRKLLFDGHRFREELGRRATHKNYHHTRKDFWCSCRSNGYFDINSTIHSLSYFVKHEGMCDKRNGTDLPDEDLQGVDKLFDLLDKAERKLGGTDKKQQPAAKEVSKGLDVLEGLGITFAVVMVVVCAVICALALRERKAGGKPCTWCPAIRIPVWLTRDIPYNLTGNLSTAS